MAFSALLDACVLYPVDLRDLLLRLAEKGLFRVLWTDEILEEMRRNIVQNHPGLVPQRLDRTIDLMNQAFEDAIVADYHGLVDAMTNHVDDRHVLAAAVRGRADVIVTENLKHFPSEACDRYGIDVQSVDEFLLYAFHLAPGTVVLAMNEQVQDNRRPLQTLRDLLVRVERVAPEFAQAAQEYVGRVSGENNELGEV
ncbi:MAG: PIN domain-containing protein [Actinobacteria bacterium]|nr:PIN domain-containing protein [Actinomycetota bacterium]